MMVILQKKFHRLSCYAHEDLLTAVEGDLYE